MERVASELDIIKMSVAQRLVFIWRMVRQLCYYGVFWSSMYSYLFEYALNLST